MSIVTTNSKYYKEIADTIRAGQQTDKSFSPDKMQNAIKQAFSHQYSLGEQDAKSEFETKYFVATVTGDGTSTISFNVPFEPDCFTIFGMDPRNIQNEHAVAVFAADVKTFAYLCGSYSINKSTSGFASGPISRKGLPTRYSWADGKGTVTALPGASSGKVGVYPVGAVYVVVAAKYTEVSDVDYLYNYIKSLEEDENGGAIMLCKERVELYYPNAGSTTNPNEDWLDLIAPAKANGWTIALT